MPKNYRELKVWQKSYELCLGMCKITAKFQKDYITMFYISYGAVCDLETQILLAGGLDLTEKSKLGTLKKDIEEIERM